MAAVCGRDMISCLSIVVSVILRDSGLLRRTLSVDRLAFSDLEEGAFESQRFRGPEGS